MRKVWEGRTFASDLKDVNNSQDELSQKAHRDFYTVLGQNSDKKHQDKFKKKVIPKGEIYQIVEQSPVGGGESQMVWIISFKCFTWKYIYTVNSKHFHLKKLLLYMRVKQSVFRTVKDNILFISTILFPVIICLQVGTNVWSLLKCVFLCFALFSFLLIQQRRELENAQRL